MCLPERSNCKKTLCGPMRIKGILLLFVFCIAMTCHAGTLGRTGQGNGQISTRMLRSMARLYMANNNYDKAAPIAQRALNIALANQPDQAELSSCYTDLAYVYMNTGKLDEAETMCKAGIKLQLQAYCATHPYVAYSLKTLSTIHRRQHQFDNAARAIEKAVEIMLVTHSADEQSIAPFYVEQAELFTEQGDHTQAEKLYERAMLLINGSYGKEHLYTARVMGSFAEMYAQSRQYEKAESVIDSALTIQENILGSDSHLLAPAWLTKARILLATGQETKAKLLIKKALTTVERNGDTATTLRVNDRIQEILSDKHNGYKTIAKAPQQ